MKESDRFTIGHMLIFTLFLTIFIKIFMCVWGGGVLGCGWGAVWCVNNYKLKLFIFTWVSGSNSHLKLTSYCLWMCKYFTLTLAMHTKLHWNVIRYNLIQTPKFLLEGPTQHPVKWLPRCLSCGWWVLWLTCEDWLDWLDWYHGYGATTLCEPRPWTSRPFVCRNLVPSVISRGALCQATPETSVSEERKWARNVR
jgi:hypothetical protein